MKNIRLLEWGFISGYSQAREHDTLDDIKKRFDEFISDDNSQSWDRMIIKEKIFTRLFKESFERGFQFSIEATKEYKKFGDKY